MRRNQTRSHGHDLDTQRSIVQYERAQRSNCFVVLAEKGSGTQCCASKFILSKYRRDFQIRTLSEAGLNAETAYSESTRTGSLAVSVMIRSEAQQLRNGEVQLPLGNRLHREF